MSNNLDLDQVAANQNNKEVTINDATGQLDAAMTETMDIDLTAGNVTVSSTNFRRHVAFAATNQPGATRTITVPAIKHLFIAQNKHATNVVAFVRGSTSINVAPGRHVLMYSDGTTNGLSSVESLTNDLLMFIPGNPAATATLARMVLTRDIAFAANFVGSFGFAGTTDGTDYDVLVKVAGSTIGTIHFAASTATATLTTVGGVVQTGDAGDTLELIGDATPGTWADFSLSLAATRV